MTDIHPDVWAHAQMYYLRPACPSIAATIRSALDFARENRLPQPSGHRLRRAITILPKDIVLLNRQAGPSGDASAPFGSAGCSSPARGRAGTNRARPAEICS